MQILCLYLLLSQDGCPVETAQLRDVEKDLQSVEFAVLNRVATQVHLCKERQVLYIGQLPHFTHVV